MSDKEFRRKNASKKGIIDLFLDQSVEKVS